MGSGGEIMQTNSNSNTTLDKGAGSAYSKNIVTRGEALKKLKIMLKDDTKLLKKVMSLAESLVENGCRYVGDSSFKGLSKQSEKPKGNPEKAARSRG